ncbi:bifunctional metallophosphatase/5'-nucleotidase [Granulicoccus sp. GXG6511]|uniref:bifunctional metallophosphatase/5'-nucleotidase n=1 Tax=Granulicoccus sp. GXG6511 TaxID=3381351 RepID=UPI003D7D159D
MQSASYASLIGKIDLGLNAEGQVDCYAMSNNAVTMSNADALAYPRAAAVKTLVDQTLAQAQVIGAQVVGNASAPITRGLSGTGDNRAVESTMTNLVAQMFREQLGSNDPEFIGVQNPGGTRADFDAGEITYQEAASILPFANTLMTTQLTGAQVKTMLEQQWQRDAAGNVPSRPFLALGLSENVTYTYDESRPEGDRITSITVNGAPIDPAKLYTIGSGSFLISGGDNFRVIADGVNARDTGRVDLEAWVDWIRAQETVSPDYARRGVSVSPLPTELVVGAPVTIAVGVPQGTTALDTLDIHTGTVKNTQLEAVLILGGTEIPVGSAAVVDGQVAALEITVPAGTAPGAGTLELRASASGTLITIPVTVTGGTTEPTPTPTPKPDNPNKGPGNNSGHDNPNRGPGNNSGHDNPNRGPGNNNGQGPGNNKGQGNTGKGEVKNAR